MLDIIIPLSFYIIFIRLIFYIKKSQSSRFYPICYYLQNTAEIMYVWKLEFFG